MVLYLTPLTHASAERMSSDLYIGQLLSLAPPGKEMVDVVNNLAALKESKKYPKLICDFFEKNNIKIKARGSEFVVSRLNCLELEEGGGNPELSYYSNLVTGEVFSMDYKNGLRVEKVLDNFENPSTGSSLFDKTKATIVANGATDSFQLFESANPDEVVIMNGLSEFMDCNFWSIHNTCQWTVRREGSSRYTVSGDVSAYVHYYENCNFHLNVGKVKIRKSTVDSIEAIFAKITINVLKLKIGLNSKFTLLDGEFEKPNVGGDSSMSTSAGSSTRFSAVMGIQPVSVLKKLRRQLPVHKVKFDWNIARVQLMSGL